MPSLTEFPGGKERSMMSLHLLGLDFLGITLIQLIWMWGMEPVGKGPSILPFAHSVARYFLIMSGWSFAELRLAYVDRVWLSL